jgi:hypothetical protein
MKLRQAVFKLFDSTVYRNKFLVCRCRWCNGYSVYHWNLLGGIRHTKYIGPHVAHGPLVENPCVIAMNHETMLGFIREGVDENTGDMRRGRPAGTMSQYLSSVETWLVCSFSVFRRKGSRP